MKLNKERKLLKNQLAKLQENIQKKIIAEQAILDLSGSKSKTYEFGYIDNGVLHWTGNLNQLAYAIYLIHDKLNLETITGYEIKKFIKKSNMIIYKGNENSLQRYFELLLGNKQDFIKNQYIDIATKIIIELFKEKNLIGQVFFFV
jgi:hypothetical protein